MSTTDDLFFLKVSGNSMNQKVKNGEVLVRQTGATKIAGPGTYMSRNFTIHAARDGVVTFVKTKKTHFSGKSLPRVRVEVR